MKISKELKKLIILDHYKDPRSKKTVQDDSYLRHHENSTSCIDDIVVQAKIDEGVITDLCFDGVACSISTAATSMMCEAFVGKTVDTATFFIQQYGNMLYEKPYDAALMGDFLVFDELSMQANRIHCGWIGMKSMQSILAQYQAQIGTDARLNRSETRQP